MKFLLFVVVVCQLLALAYANGMGSAELCNQESDILASSPFWPQPQSFDLGKSQVKLSGSFKFVQTQRDKSERLNRAFDRYVNVIHGSQGNGAGDASAFTQCDVEVKTILSPEEEKQSLDLDVDESYAFSIDESGNCKIESKTIWGAIHALESFTQLLTRDGSTVAMNYAPVKVMDAPRYSHRGILVDSARHFLPVNSVKSILETFPMSNFNVMHWHIVDAQSFPVDTPSAPEIIKGAFAPYLTYSMSQVAEVHNFAADLGVRIVYEFDGPGHTASWGKGYPDILADCLEKYHTNINNLAVNPVKDKTYEVLASIMKDVVDATGTTYMHLGGDEVVYGCWAEDDSITSYMKEHDITSYPDLLGLYVQKADAIVDKMEVTPIHWEDTFMAGVRPQKNVIFDIWTDSTNVALVTDAGYRAIVASQDYWYLDHAKNTWDVMWSYEPTANLTSSQAKLIVGGEASMWGEHVDETNIQAKIWPTAAAVGEKLWSPMDATLPANQDDAYLRLLAFRCRMNARGYASTPLRPGYCAVQYV